MIVTVTLNPAVDEEYLMPHFASGQWTRSLSSQRTPGGSGVNVALMLQQMGYETAAMGFLAGFNGDYIRDALRRAGITTNFVHVPGETRTNVNIIDTATESETCIVEEGPKIDAEAVRFFLANYSQMLNRASAVVLGGSLPPGVPVDFYRDLCLGAREAGLPVYVNAVGPELMGALAGDPLYANVDHRFLMGTGSRIDDSVEAQKRAVSEVRALGVRWAVASCQVGGEVFSTPAGIWLANCREKMETRSLFTFDDAITAGIVTATLEGMEVQDAVKFAMACALEDSSHSMKGVRSRRAVEDRVESVSLRRLD